MTYTVFLVHSVSHAMKGEKVLERTGIPHKLIPAPRSLASDCGVCLRIPHEERERAEEALRAAGLEIKAIHDLDDPLKAKETPRERADEPVGK